MQLNFKSSTYILLLFISLVAWCFITIVINPELHYYIQQSAFLTNSLFFQSFAKYPGGIADYISEFISQFFYYKTLGSFLIVLIAATQGILAMGIVQRVAGTVKLRFSIFALILLLSSLVLCNYHYPFYASIRLLLAFCFIYIFTELIQRFPRSGFWTNYLFSLLLFYLAGGATLFIFAISAILMQIRFSRNSKTLLSIPFFIIFCGTMPFIAYKYLFLVNFPLLYSITHSKSPAILFYSPDIKLYTLYCILPVYIILALLFHQFKRNPEPEPIKLIATESANKPLKKTGKQVAKQQNEIKSTNKRKTGTFWSSPTFVLSAQFTVLFIVAIICFNLSFDKEEKNKIMVSFYGANSDWNNVIKTAENLKEYDLFANFEYNKALANTGKLATNLLNFNQLAGSGGLFLDSKVTSDVPFVCSDQYYDLGFMHESQHWTFEAQTIFPNSPRLMKRLVQINLVLGRYNVAEKFLYQLNDNMLCHVWVSKYLKYINDTSLVAKDPEFSWKRKCEPNESFAAENYRQKLIKLLEANPANKMAYEYFVCATLLDGDLGLFDKLLREHKILLTNPLPRSWEEALVLYNYVTRKELSSGDIKFTKEKQMQFISFLKAIKPFGNDWQSARKSLEQSFGTTYWYYIKCLSPKVTKVQIKQQKSDD